MISLIRVNKISIVCYKPYLEIHKWFMFPFVIFVNLIKMKISLILLIIIQPSQKWFIIKIAASKGFSFHHTKGKLLMMTKWLDKERESKLPGFATHYCGVGGFVMNECDEVLIIKDIKLFFINYSCYSLEYLSSTYDNLL